MRFKVELHRDVVWFVRHRCNAAEREAFYRTLHLVRSNPVDAIEHSEPISDPAISRYILRFFRFSGCLAIFKLNVGKNRIRVLECRRVPPRNIRGRKPSDPP